MYGLFAVAISYSLYMVGFDFYVYSTRELVGVPLSQMGGLLKTKGVFFLVTYAFVLPIFLLIFLSGLLPWAFLGWFFVILVLEHIAQELMRILIVLRDQVLASCVLFLRSGCWALAVLGLMGLNPDLRSLETVLAAWALGGLFAVAVGFLRLRQHDLGGWSRLVDWPWLQKGLKVVFPFLVGTLALRALYTLDRFFVERLAGLEVLGAYTLFIGVASVIKSFLEAAVFVFVYPILIRSFKVGDGAAFSRAMASLAAQTIIITAVLAGLIVLSLPHFLRFLDHDVYLGYIHVFFWVLLAVVLHALGMIPHYGLYARGQDKAVIAAHVVGLIAFIVLVWWSGEFFGVLAVPISLCVAVSGILLMKSVFFMLARTAAPVVRK